MAFVGLLRNAVCLGSMLATFRAFDPQQTGRVTMDFNQMIYGFSNCRS